MAKDQLDLITLTVTPEEARMLATASSVRSIALYNFIEEMTEEEWGSEDTWDGEGEYPNRRLSRKYRELSSKVDRQRQL